MITTAETCTITSLTSSQKPNLDDQNHSITNVQTIKSEQPESILFHYRLPMDSGSLKHNLATNQPVLVTPNGLQLSVEMLQDMYSQNILAASVAANTGNYIQIDSLQQSSNNLSEANIKTEANLPSTSNNCIKTETSEQMKDDVNSTNSNSNPSYSQMTCTSDGQLLVGTSYTQQQQSYNDQLQQTTNIIEQNAGISLQKDTDIGYLPSPQNILVKQLLKNLITHKLACAKDESTNTLLLDTSEKHTTSDIQKQQLTNIYGKLDTNTLSNGQDSHDNQQITNLSGSQYYMRVNIGTQIINIYR